MRATGRRAHLSSSGSIIIIHILSIGVLLSFRSHLELRERPGPLHLHRSVHCIQHPHRHHAPISSRSSRRSRRFGNGGGRRFRHFRRIFCLPMEFDLSKFSIAGQEGWPTPSSRTATRCQSQEGTATAASPSSPTSRSPPQSHQSTTDPPRDAHGGPPPARGAPPVERRRLNAAPACGSPSGSGRAGVLGGEVVRVTVPRAGRKTCRAIAVRHPGRR